MLKKVVHILGLLFISYQVVASKNPISWVQTQNLPATLLVNGGTYVASYTFTNQVPLTMVNPLTILKTTNASSEITYDDLCTGTRLAYQQSCTVTVYLTPSSSGLKTIQLSELYGHDEVPLPGLSTMAVGGSGSGDIVGAINQALPPNLNINSNAPWNFIFTNNGAVPVTGINISVQGDSYQTTCTSSLSNVAPNNTCTVSGNYTPPAAVLQTISTTFSYAQGAPVTLSTSTTGTLNNIGLVCTAAVPLPPEMALGTSSNVTLLCTNKSGNPITGITRVIGAPAQGHFTPSVGGGDSCDNLASLPSGAACQLQGTYTAPNSSATGETISLVVTYAGSSTASASTTTDVVSQITNSRTINLVNNCNFDVWWSMAGGAVTGASCAQGCPVGSSCNTSSGYCYYNNNGPSVGGYKLPANVGTASTIITETPASVGGALWKGLISASTMCDGSATCLNNSCNNNGGSTACAPGVGFEQPATEAEFTFLLQGSNQVDTYDISNVNGFSMPISMATNQTATDYNCGAAGNYQAANGLNGCNYSSVTPPTNMYYWVQNTGTPCATNNTCSTAGQICGLAFDPSVNNYTKNCGAFLGYWSANQICQTNPSFTSPFGDNFSCKQMLTSPFPDNTYTLTQLLKCSPPNAAAPLFNSCYLSYPGAQPSDLQQCCGCTDWNGIANPSSSCPVGQTNPQWTSYVKPLIQWMKQACPTSYSYPYDDKASTFQCTASPSTSYTITFCPGNSAGGLPAGKTDGR